MATKGRIFEELVYALTSSLHEKAKVTFDTKLPDKVTGALRQIDILVEVTEGPTTFRAIIEARERSRPVGVNYVEEVRSKREDVGADRAVIVSNKGFAKTALKKASFYGITAFSLREALREKWSETLSRLDGVTIHSIGADLKYWFLTDDDYVINPHPDLAERMKKEGSKVLLASHPTEDRAISARSVMDYVFKELNVAALVDSDLTRRHPISVSITFPLADGLTFTDETGAERPLTKLAVSGEVWRKTEIARARVKQYKDEKTGEVLAEVLSADSPALPVEMIMEYPGRVGTNRRILFKRRP